jgi:hypothetical protein
MRFLVMDEAKKKTVALMAAVLAERRLCFLNHDKEPLEVRRVICECLHHAELILGEVEKRWPRDKIPGLN